MIETLILQPAFASQNRGRRPSARYRAQVRAEVTQDAPAGTRRQDRAISARAISKQLGVRWASEVRRRPLGRQHGHVGFAEMTSAARSAAPQLD